MGEWYCEDCLPRLVAELDEEERALAMQELNAKFIGIVAGVAIFHWLDR